MDHYGLGRTGVVFEIVNRVFDRFAFFKSNDVRDEQIDIERIRMVVVQLFFFGVA